MYVVGLEPYEMNGVRGRYMVHSCQSCLWEKGQVMNYCRLDRIFGT